LSRTQRFKPERFLERQFSPYEFFPFGGSNRRCIGAAFALFEMKLATILKRYKLALTEASGGSCPARCIAPQGGIKMKLIGQCSLTEASPAVMSSSHWGVRGQGIPHA